MVLQAVLHPLTVTAITRGFEAKVFTGRMTFLSPNKQREWTERWWWRRRHCFCWLESHCESSSVNLMNIEEHWMAANYLTLWIDQSYLGCKSVCGLLVLTPTITSNKGLMSGVLSCLLWFAASVNTQCCVVFWRELECLVDFRVPQPSCLLASNLTWTWESV